MYAKFVQINQLYVLACASKHSMTKPRFLLYYSFYFQNENITFIASTNHFFFHYMLVILILRHKELCRDF